MGRDLSRVRIKALACLLPLARLPLQYSGLGLASGVGGVVGFLGG